LGGKMMRNIIIIFFIFINISISFSEEIEMRSNAKIIDNELIINFVINNKSHYERYFIQTTEWLFWGDSIWNRVYLPTNPHLLNMIYYFPEEFRKIGSEIEIICGDFIIDSKAMPSIIEIHPNESITIELKYSLDKIENYFIRGKSYNMVIDVAYSDGYLMSEISHALRCDIYEKNIDKSTRKDKKYLVKLKTVKNRLKKGMNYCKGCDINKYSVRILQLGFLNRIKTQCILKVE
jgi:hypothetical protein